MHLKVLQRKCAITAHSRHTNYVLINFTVLPVFQSFAAVVRFSVCLWSLDISAVQTLVPDVILAPPRMTNETCWSGLEGLGLHRL